MKHRLSDVALTAVIGLPIWWTGWHILDALLKLVTI